MKKLILFLLILLVLFPIINAQPPTDPIITEGYDLQINEQRYIDGQDGYTLRVHVFNETSGALKDNSTVGCTLHFNGKNGSELLFKELDYDVTHNEFYVDITSGNFSVIGNHPWVIYCNSSDQGGYREGTLEITNNGESFLTTESILYSSIILFLLFLSLFCAYICISTDQVSLKVLSFYGSYVFIQLSFYLSWIVTENYFTFASFIPFIFKWLFIIMTIILFPLFIATIVWYLYLLISMRPMKRMLEKGRVSDPKLSDRVKRDMRKIGRGGSEEW